MMIKTLFWNKEVGDFLTKNPELYPILEEAQYQVRHYFGDQTGISFDLCHEPSDGSVELFILVDPLLSSVDEEFRRLNQFDDKWFLDVASKCDGKLNVTIRYYDSERVL